MLVLADRGFDAGEFLTELAATGARFLVRLRSNRRLPVAARLPDGSWPLAQLAALVQHGTFSTVPGVPHDFWFTHPEVWTRTVTACAAL